MTVTKTTKLLVRKIDRLVLILLGANKDAKNNLMLPKQYTAAELKRRFIRDFVTTQPSLLQVVLLKLYSNLRHLIAYVPKRVIRGSRGTSS